MTSQIQKPELSDKKYKYYHKKLGKWMLNNELFEKDLKKYLEFKNQNKDK